MKVVLALCLSLAMMAVCNASPDPCVFGDECDGAYNAISINGLTYCCEYSVFPEIRSIVPVVCECPAVTTRVGTPVYREAEPDAGDRGF